MPIISLAQTKGGCAKSTMAQSLAYSNAFKRKYKSIALVELDIQGTLKAWHSKRDSEQDAVSFTLIDSDNQKTIGSLLKSLDSMSDCMILDLPGESRTQFITALAVAASDVVLVPMRSSTNDETSFGSHLLPMLRDYYEKVFILPVFVHVQANQKKVKGYFDYVMPDGIHTLSHSLPTRSVYEFYGEEGLTIGEYAKSVKSNARDHKQALAAVNDIEAIAKEVIRHAG